MVYRSVPEVNPVLVANEDDHALEYMEQYCPTLLPFLYKRYVVKNWQVGVLGSAALLAMLIAEQAVAHRLASKGSLVKILIPR